MKTPTHLSTVTRQARNTLLLLTTIGLIGAGPARLQAATISDLLEQGVYAEETRGDLDAAMKLYRQILQEARQGTTITAQAQYRLGVCYYKQRRFAEANAAFESVISNYPQEKELVRMAGEYLAGAVALLPAPWADGEEMRLSIKTPIGFELGFVSYAVRPATRDGKQVWRLSSRLVAGPKQASLVDVEADSFKPIHSRWKHSLLGDADAVYSGGKATITMKGKDEKESRTTDLGGVSYDNEAVVQLIRRLPLAPDYRTTLRVFSSLGGGNIIPIEIKVIGFEMVETPAGRFNCHRIHLGTVNQTFWYSADKHRYLVKFDAGVIKAELTDVRLLTPGEIEAQETAAFDFPLGEPGGGVPTVQEQDTQPLQRQAKLRWNP